MGRQRRFSRLFTVKVQCCKSSTHFEYVISWIYYVQVMTIHKYHLSNREEHASMAVSAVSERCSKWWKSAQNGCFGLDQTDSEANGNALGVHLLGDIATPFGWILEVCQPGMYPGCRLKINQIFMRLPQKRCKFIFPTNLGILYMTK